MSHRHGIRMFIRCCYYNCFASYFQGTPCSFRGGPAPNPDTLLIHMQDIRVTSTFTPRIKGSHLGPQGLISVRGLGRVYIQLINFRPNILHYIPPVGEFGSGFECPNMLQCCTQSWDCWTILSSLQYKS